MAILRHYPIGFLKISPFQAVESEMGKPMSHLSVEIRHCFACERGGYFLLLPDDRGINESLWWVKK